MKQTYKEMMKEVEKEMDKQNHNLPGAVISTPQTANYFSEALKDQKSLSRRIGKIMDAGLGIKRIDNIDAIVEEGRKKGFLRKK